MKVLFIDVDGTLLNYEYKLPDSALNAVILAKEKGHKIILCTGRSFPEIDDCVWNCHPDGFIGGNGAYIEYDNEIIYHEVMPYNEVIRVLDYFKVHHIEYFVECNEGLFASENFLEAGNKRITTFAYQKGLKEPESQSIEKLFPTMQYQKNCYRDDLNKISYTLNNIDDFYQVKTLFPSFDHFVWGNDVSKAVFADIRIKGINKASGLKVIVEHLGISYQDTIAFGDAKIDKSMLLESNIGVAMGNAPESLKQIADYVSDDVDNDGLYKAFKHLNLI